MLHEKASLVLRVVAVVYFALLLFFLGYFLLIRGPHVSTAQVIGFSALLAAVVTGSAFGGGWAIKRCAGKTQIREHGSPKE